MVVVVKHQQQPPRLHLVDGSRGPGSTLCGHGQGRVTTDPVRSDCRNCRRIFNRRLAAPAPPATLESR